MKSYWIWLLLHLATWTCAIQMYVPRIADEYWRLIGVALYFLVFFILPLFANRPKMVWLLLGINTVLTALTLMPRQTDAFGTPDSFNLFILLLFALLLGESVQQLSLRNSAVIGLLQIASLIFHIIFSEPTLVLFIIMTMILLFCAVFRYKMIWENELSTRTRYDALLDEYRKTKRNIVSDEEIARQEERTFIGQEIHDSVGHKLTALLMQLEAFRLKAPNQDKTEIHTIKQLAEESLEETRKAVKAFKREEIGGLQGVLRLIRRLEMSSFLRIHFSIRHGAFTAPLSGEQSFVLYRSIQEALTNMMKHSRSREADVAFEAPGGSVFRFEVRNPAADNPYFKEGFGLTAIRERLEKIGGSLDVSHTGGQFVVQGQFSLLKEEEQT